MGYGGQVDVCSTTQLGRNMSISERLYQQKKDLQERIALVDKAIEAFEKTPGLQESLDAISKVGLY